MYETQLLQNFLKSYLFMCTYLMICVFQNLKIALLTIYRFTLFKLTIEIY